VGIREPVPPFRANDSRFGRLGGGDDPPTLKRMCGHWMSAVVARDEWAITHVSFPESNVQDACFTPVAHDGRKVTVSSPPRGCRYPDRENRARLDALATELESPR
jgi:hypothetical protein